MFAQVDGLPGALTQGHWVERLRHTLRDRVLPRIVESYKYWSVVDGEPCAAVDLWPPVPGRVHLRSGSGGISAAGQRTKSFALIRAVVVGVMWSDCRGRCSRDGCRRLRSSPPDVITGGDGQVVACGVGARAACDGERWSQVHGRAETATE